MRLDEDQVIAIADELIYFLPESPVFAVNGCKRVDEKVNLYRYRPRRHYEL